MVKKCRRLKRVTSPYTLKKYSLELILGVKSTGSVSVVCLEVRNLLIIDVKVTCHSSHHHIPLAGLEIIIIFLLLQQPARSHNYLVVVLFLLVQICTSRTCEFFIRVGHLCGMHERSRLGFERETNRSSSSNTPRRAPPITVCGCLMSHVETWCSALQTHPI